MRKVYSYIRWFLIMLINFLGWLSAKVIFPFAYILRKISLFRKNILWLYYGDDDPILGPDWYRDSFSFGWHKNWWSKFRLAYDWNALRNPAWNLQASLTPRDGVKKLVSSKGKAIRNGVEVDEYKFCGFKYVDKDGTYKNNKGDFLSLKFSTIGRISTWYIVNGVLYWRYSFAKRINKKFWIEIHLGTNNYRYTFRFKIKWNLKIYEEQ